MCSSQRRSCEYARVNLQIALMECNHAKIYDEEMKEISIGQRHTFERIRVHICVQITFQCLKVCKTNQKEKANKLMRCLAVVGLLLCRCTIIVLFAGNLCAFYITTTCVHIWVYSARAR